MLHVFPILRYTPPKQRSRTVSGGEGLKGLVKFQTRTLKTTFVWYLFSLLKILQFNPLSIQSNIRTIHCTQWT